jgi:hypothetical protein
VVGEQVTVKLYMYGGRGPYNGSNLVDFTHADFLDYSGKDDGDANETVRVPIGDTVYLARKVRELALFPLHAGRLVIGPASLTFSEGRYRANLPIVRSTQPPWSTKEPPMDGRPAGYRWRRARSSQRPSTRARSPRRQRRRGGCSRARAASQRPPRARATRSRVERSHARDEVHADKGVVRGFRLQLRRH